MNTFPSGAPLVSVCIPVYNGADYIRETVTSVLKQVHRPLEVVVQDNASTDETWHVLEELAREHPELSIARNVMNFGMAGNWNIALRRAKGDYVALLSADDLMLDSFVERCLDVFAKEHDAAVVTTNHYWLKGSTRIKRRMRCLPGRHHAFAALVMLANPFSINFSLFSRKFVDQCFANGPMFREDVYTCDYDLWLKAALSGEEVFYLAEELGAYRVHDSNLSTQTKRMQRHTLLVLTSHRKSYKGWVRVAYVFTLFRFLFRAFWPKGRAVDRRLVKALKLAIRIA